MSRNLTRTNLKPRLSLFSSLVVERRGRRREREPGFKVEPKQPPFKTVMKWKKCEREIKYKTLADKPLI